MPSSKRLEPATEKVGRLLGREAEKRKLRKHESKEEEAGAARGTRIPGSGADAPNLRPLQQAQAEGTKWE